MYGVAKKIDIGIAALGHNVAVRIRTAMEAVGSSTSTVSHKHTIRCISEHAVVDHEPLEPSRCLYETYPYTAALQDLRVQLYFEELDRRSVRVPVSNSRNIGGFNAVFECILLSVLPTQ